MIKGGGFSVTWLGVSDKDREKKKGHRRGRKQPQEEKDHEHVARRNSKCLDYTAGEADRQADTRID